MPYLTLFDTEIPISKKQFPNNFQTPNLNFQNILLEFGYWYLRFIWKLELVSWSFRIEPGEMRHGERVSNTLVTYPQDGHNSSKEEIIPDGLPPQMRGK